MMSFLEISGLDSDSLFLELDKTYYKDHPEQWELDGENNDWYVSHPEYAAMFTEGHDGCIMRQRQPGEKATPQYIQRDGYHLYRVGRIISVKQGKLRDISSTEIHRAERNNGQSIVTEEISVQINPDDIIGKLRLIEIIPGRKTKIARTKIFDKLVYEVIQKSSKDDQE